MSKLRRVFRLGKRQIKKINNNLLILKDRYIDGSAKKIARDKKLPIKLYWYREPHNNIYNMGDEISRELIQNLFGYKVIWTNISECEMIAVGSIIDVIQEYSIKQPIKVWGSGFIKPGHENNLKNLSFYAVRGKKTRKRIDKKVTLGDPGILVNLIYPAARKKNNKIGIVVHYIDQNMPIVKKIAKDKRFKLINPLDKPSVAVKQISQCKLILSSSLHGLIFADSYKIPNAHIKLSDKVVGGEYKFLDYCSGVGKKYTQADLEKIFDDDYLRQLIRNYKPIKFLKILQKRLIKSFPFKDS